MNSKSGDRSELAVIGDSTFTLGFRLTGIKRVVNIKEEKDMSGLLNDKGLGIVITNQHTFDSFSEQLKEDVTNSIQPVAVVVSDKPQEELRNMIIKAIGVDLLKD
jgi:vacuolar-type H+-ATPase subunit F/Vma7